MLLIDLEKSFEEILTPFADHLNDLHVYDPAAQAWTDLSNTTVGVPPSSRSGHGFTAIGARLYVHGGFNGSGEGTNINISPGTEQ